MQAIWIATEYSNRIPDFLFYCDGLILLWGDLSLIPYYHVPGTMVYCEYLPTRFWYGDIMSWYDWLEK